MKVKLQQLQANQLARRLRGLSRSDLREPPGKGWIRSVREALGMSYYQLAKRIGVSQPTVVNWERREAKGTISLQSIKKVADALQCDLIYVLAPRKPFGEILKDRAMQKAQIIVEQTGRSMSLEDQQTSLTYRRRAVKETARELLERNPRRLWDS